MDSVLQQIEKKLTKVKKGQVLLLSDFRGLGNEISIRQALSRLNKLGKIKRVAHGIYLVPKIDPLFGEVMPSLEDIAKTIATKEHIKIKPTGAYALHKLGLTTQVPMRLVYLTNGPSKLIKIGKSTIRFKSTTPKKLATAGQLSSLILQALEEIGTENIEPKAKERMRELLMKEDIRKLMKDIKRAPAKVSDFLFTLLNEK
jgi:hypothetical protein